MSSKREQSSANLLARWVVLPLGEAVKPTRPRIKPALKPHLHFIGMENVEAHTMKLLGTVPGARMKSSAVHFQSGDVLYGRLRPYLNKVYRPEFEGLCSAEFIVFPQTEGINNRYLQYFLNSSAFVSFASHLNTGDRPRVDFDQLAPYPFPIPPPKDQERIVAEIEKQFSRLDEAVANLKRVKANLKRYKAAVLKAAVEGKLTEDWRKKHPNIEPASKLLERILAERRAKWYGRAGYSAPAQPDISSLPELPNGWVWVRLDTIAALKGGITVDKNRKSSTARTVPYLRVANVQRGYLDLSVVKEIKAPEADIRDLRLVPGDILFNEGGDRDKLGRGWVWEGRLPECIHQNHVFRARLYLADLSPKFVSWWGNSFGQTYFLREGKQTTNLASINITKLSAFPIPLPPAAEQQQIVAEVERRLSVIEELEAAVEANLTRADRLRQAILQRAFAGQLVPQGRNELVNCPSGSKPKGSRTCHSAMKKY